MDKTNQLSNEKSKKFFLGTNKVQNEIDKILQKISRPNTLPIPAGNVAAAEDNNLKKLKKFEEPALLNPIQIPFKILNYSKGEIQYADIHEVLLKENINFLDLFLVILELGINKSHYVSEDLTEPQFFHAVYSQSKFNKIAQLIKQEDMVYYWSKLKYINNLQKLATIIIESFNELVSLDLNLKSFIQMITSFQKISECYPKFPEYVKSQFSNCTQEIVKNNNIIEDKVKKENIQYKSPKYKQEKYEETSENEEELSLKCIDQADIDEIISENVNLNIDERISRSFQVIEELSKIYSDFYNRDYIERVYNVSCFDIQATIFLLNNPEEHMEGFGFRNIDELIITEMKDSIYYQILVRKRGKDKVDLKEYCMKKGPIKSEKS